MEYDPGKKVGLAELQVRHREVCTKIERITNCLIQLDEFCHNKLLDYLNADQIYGHINTFIQSVLREQLFVELLVMTLLNSFPTHRDLEDLRKTEIVRRDKKTKRTKAPVQYTTKTFHHQGTESDMRQLTGTS
jgi:hypothetical protein